MTTIQQIKPNGIFFKVKSFKFTMSIAILLLLFAFIFSILYISFYYYQLNQNKKEAEEKSNSQEVTFENFVPPEKTFLIVSYSCIVLVFILTTIAFHTYSKIFRFKFSLPFLIIFILVALGIGCVILNSIYWQSIPNICPSNYTLSGDECHIKSFTPRFNDTYWVKTQNKGKTLLKFYNMENFVCFETSADNNPNNDSQLFLLSSSTIFSGETPGYMVIDSSGTAFYLNPIPSVGTAGLCFGLDDGDDPMIPPPTFTYTTQNEVIESQHGCAPLDDFKNFACSQYLPFYNTFDGSNEPMYPVNQTPSLPYNISSIEFTNNMQMYIGMDNNFYIMGTAACVKIITSTGKYAQTYQACVSQNNTLKNGFLIIDFLNSTKDEENSGDMSTRYKDTTVGFISVIPTKNDSGQKFFACQRGVYTTEIDIFAASKTYKPVTGLNSIQLDENNSLKAEDDKLILSSFDKTLHFMLNDNTGDFFTVGFADKYMWYNSAHEWGYNHS